MMSALGKRVPHSRHEVAPWRNEAAPWRTVIMWCDHSAADRLRAATRLPWPASCAAPADTCRPNSTCPNSYYSKRRTWMERVGLALELVYFLTLKCISALERSMNTLSCKFLYQPPLAGPGWEVGFYRAIAARKNDAARIGTRAQYPGDALGKGGAVAAARELGLAPGTAGPLFNADAGWLGSISATRATSRRDRRRTECPTACNGCARSAHLRPQHLPDVAGALALPRAGSVGLVTQGAHH